MVTPFSFEVESIFVLGFLLAFDSAVVAILVSITDELVFSGEVGAGLLAVLAFFGKTGITAVGFTAAGFFGGLFASFLRTAALLAGAATLPALTGTAGLLVLFAATGFFGAGVFLLAVLAFDFVTAAGFALLATLGAAFLTGLVAAFGFTVALAVGLAVGLARATTLVDLALDLDSFVDFAISVLTPS